jgi:NADPH-dependent ferric siderophore reductase
MGLYPRLMPRDPEMFRAKVARTARLSQSFQRVTVTGPELDGFNWAGFDHWFRLFLPPADQALALPRVEGRAWWRSYQSIPKARRPHCSNYTVADCRRGPQGTELDIDVVLHWNQAGEPAGGVAAWAVAAEPGSELGILDQGIMFDPPPDTVAVRLAADATGLPAVRGILRSLGEDAVGDAVVEVPDAGDIVELEAPAGVKTEWVTPAAAHSWPGQAALAWLENAPAIDPAGYAFVVGESGLATGGRRALRRQGLAKSRITFKGFWKQGHAD